MFVILTTIVFKYFNIPLLDVIALIQWNYFVIIFHINELFLW